MPGAHTEELVYATTEDGLLLEGLALRPAGDGAARAVSLIWIHGNAASFSAPGYVALGRALVGLGYPVVLGNTRGHDIAATLWRADGGLPVGGGAGWELLGEAPRDLAAWVELAATLGSGGVVLAGHSSGAQRVVLYQAQRQDPRVAGIVLASPDLRGFFPPGELAAARELVAEGHGSDVTPAQPWAPWYRQSAQTVVEKADILARLLTADDGAPTIAAVRGPLLTFYGANEPAGAAAQAAIQREARAAGPITAAVVPGADHFYTGCAAAVAQVIARWAADLGAA